MKVFTVAVFAVVVGLALAEPLNEDQRRDELMYTSKRRTKRALCGNQRVTVRPTWYRFTKPAQCRSCFCSQPPFVVSKRAVSSSLFRSCPNYSLCCSNPFPIRPIVAKGSASLDANKMASSLLDMYGKRATNANFKKASVDLVFLIDDSGSIPAAQFTVAKEGAATLSQALCPHTFGSQKGGKQVSVVLFSTTAKTVLTYEQSQKGEGYVEDVILNLKQRSGSTSTADALKHVRENVITQPGNRLNDKDTATIVFVVTDGKCNNGCGSLVAEAKKLREAGPGVQVFAFGVGEADCQELEDIRGKDAGQVFGLPDYNFFEKLANAVKEQMAKNSDICVKD